MTDIKKTLKIAGIWCLIATILSIISLFANVYVFEFSYFYIVGDILAIILSILTGITYLSFSKKSKEKILNHKNVFFILSLINIFNNFIVWVLSFWVQIMFNREIRTANFKQVFTTSQKHTTENTNDNEIIIDENNYEIQHSAQTLTSRLQELKDLRNKNLISEEEYENLRQEALRKFMSS